MKIMTFWKVGGHKRTTGRLVTKELQQLLKYGVIMGWIG